MKSKVLGSFLAAMTPQSCLGSPISVLFWPLGHFLAIPEEKVTRTAYR